MRQSEIQYYCCPARHSPLDLVNASVAGEEVDSGELISRQGRRYQIENGIPNLIYPDELSPVEAQTKAEYDGVAESVYDAAMEWQFAAIYEDENRVREGMLALLEIKPKHRVLEVGCGTGRDSHRLARLLGTHSSLFLQDLSPKMVHACRAKLQQYDRDMPFRCNLHYSISNATHLPFPSRFFDAVFHFGGFNQFGHAKATAAEFSRVTRLGGRIVYGDESVAPWLRGSEFDRIVCTNNPLFRHELPLASIPEGARDVSVRWVMANCFYLIAFTNGEGPPSLDLDLPHQGWRGGTMRSRYFGVLEGVAPETKELARKAAALTGLSVHEWLDRLVRRQGEQDLAGRGPETGRER
jgi:ubiquinone/menaquinone biosynthesis C-methylase UbiE/uncharacterized protein YbaR (Trm112 family)